MEEEEQGVVATSAPQPPSLCEECKANPSKYKCPGCALRTCSLPCVKSHKLRTNCSGKPDLSHTIPLSQFDDNRLLSDFNMLEDVKRVAESARRMRMKLCGFAQYRLPSQLKSLQSAAASRRTRLLFLPSGMSRRERNQTRYNRRKKFISWTIEWRFHSTDAVLLDHGILESTTLRSVIEKHLQPSPWNHKLKKFCEEELENLKFFIRKYPKGPKSPFRELDTNVSVKELLSNIVVCEYPVIHVFLPSHSYDFEVVRDIKPPQIKPELKPPEKSDIPSPHNGRVFKELKEEEIDDGNDLDPQILDLLKGSGVGSVFQASCHDQRAPDNLANQQSTERNSPDNTLQIQRTETDGVLSKTNIEEIEDFDFDQGLIDAYSYILAQSNPDDFFDFDLEVEGGDKLEEGEIPSSE
ncbi:hypothetical protein Dimus_023384 [Dionaea muscipula]